MSAHKTEAELLELLRECPRRNSIWRHHRGHLYQIVGVSIDEATLQPRVHCEGLYGLHVPWSLPLSEWLGMVEVDGRAVRRFVEVD